MKIGDISSTLNDEIVLYGSSNSNISGDKTENRIRCTDYWIINIDTIGNINWQKTIGGIGTDFNFGGFQTSANKIILTGSSDSNIGGDKTENSGGDIDFWLVELTVSTVGIAKSKKEYLDFKIYPNPAKDFLNIHIQEKTAFEIEIYNTLGELVVQENMNGYTKKFNISHLAEGSYIIKLISEEDTRSRVFVK